MQKLNQKIAKQKGAALIVFALLIVLTATAFLVSVLDGRSLKIEQNKKTLVALSEAKSALIGFALKSGQMTGLARPGDLPCPDANNDGSSEPSCIGNAMGRLPWKTLGISDLRDSANERLWYAVSTQFKRNPITPMLNSDTFGSITLRDSEGQIVKNGTMISAAIAVLIAPGSPLTRQDGLTQNRTLANINNSVHYLDNFDSANNSKDEDNSEFIGSTTNGFIDGPIKNGIGADMVNDHIVAIGYNDLMPLIEKRVAGEIRKRIKTFGGLPWAAPFINPTISNNNFAPVNGVNGGLLPAYPHYWNIFDSQPLAAYLTRMGTVANADLTSGFVEPGYCSNIGAQIICSGRKKIQGDTVWRTISINITGTLNVNNSFASAPMNGTLTITDTRISDGVVLGSGSITPTPTTEILIRPQVSTLFPQWLTANNWHQLAYYSVATPFVYSSSSPAVCGTCLSVMQNGVTINNIGSVVMIAGRKLDATDKNFLIPQNRPSDNLDDYFDTTNNSSGGIAFESRRVITPTFNDQLVIIEQ